MRYAKMINNIKGFKEGGILRDSFYQILGAKLRACRRIKKMTISEIAEKINKSIATVSKYEKGEIAIDIETLFVWCNFMEVDIASLLPHTCTESVSEQITRYQNHLVERLYVYNYRSKGHKIDRAVIECDNKACKATMYLFAEDEKNYFDCKYLYEGDVIYGDTHINFILKNSSPPFDMLTLSIPTMPGKNEYTIGMLMSTTVHYENVALKILVSDTPVMDLNLLEEKTRLTAQELRNIKMTNFFIVE